jgi:hypothetical protein
MFLLLLLQTIGSISCASASGAARGPPLTDQQYGARALQNVINGIESGPYASHAFNKDYALPAFHRGVAGLRQPEPLTEPLPLIAVLRQQTESGGTLEVGWLASGLNVAGVSVSIAGSAEVELPVFPPETEEEKPRLRGSFTRDRYFRFELSETDELKILSPVPDEREMILAQLPRRMLHSPVRVRLLLRDPHGRSSETCALYVLDVRGMTRPAE